jgi:hypothetical protein
MKKTEYLVGDRSPLYASVALGLTLAWAAASPAQTTKPDPPGATNVPPPVGAILDLSGMPIPGGGNGTYQQYTVNFTATLTSTAITFAFRDDPARISLANASVTDLTHPSGNLLANSDFSGGTYSIASCGSPRNVAVPNSWTYANPYCVVGAGSVFPNSSGLCFGPFCWDDGAVQAYDEISQTIPTTAGDTYQISFLVGEYSGCQTSEGHPITPCNFSDVSTNGDILDQFGNGINITVYAQAGLPAPAEVLWLGNDTSGDVFETTTTGTVVADVGTLQVTGIAWDGSNLYFADPAGNYTKRTADGMTVLDSFALATGDTGEDLAWDGKRNVLWRIIHFTNTLQKIDPVGKSLVASYAIPTSDPGGLGTLGGLGVAYDSTRDELNVSFCQQGCSPLAAGLVDRIDPNTGIVLGALFRTSGFYTGGLAYDPSTDTLYVGDFTMVRHMDRSGNVLASFSRPAPGGFVDGLEFVSRSMQQAQTTPVVTFSSTTNTTVSVVFNNNNGQHVEGDAFFPPSGDLMFPAGIDPTTFTFQETNRFVTQAGVESLTHNTPFATLIPFDHAGNDALGGTTGLGAKYEVICADATHPPAEVNCPAPTAGNHISFKDVFDLPTDGSGNFMQPGIAPFTTVSFAHWAPETIPNDTSWSPSGGNINPHCPNVFGRGTTAFQCNLEDPLVNKYAASNGFGSDTRKGDYLLGYNVPMPCSAWKVNGVPVNTPCVQGNSTFFVHSPLTLDFLANPAQCNPALPLACGNGWLAGPIFRLFWTFDPLASAPDLPGTTNLDDLMNCPGANCNVTSVNQPGAGPPVLPVEFTTTAMPEPEGQFELQVSAEDSVLIKERNIQLLPVGSPIPCPNPFPHDANIPAAGPVHPCYSTKLFNLPITVDNTNPTISSGPTLSTPGSPMVTVTYTCSDIGSPLAADNSGIAICGATPPGTVHNVHALGGPGAGPSSVTEVDTLPNAVGSYSFTVQATDVAGNLSAPSQVNYTVYNICPLYDQTKAVHSGATVTVKLFLCDSTGTVDPSSANIVVHATGLFQTSTSTSDPVVDAGSANPDMDFRFDPTLGPSGGYIFNLKTTGLGTGNWVIQFTVAGDPTLHSLGFGIK